MNDAEGDEWWNDDDWWYDESGEVSQVWDSGEASEWWSQENGVMKEDQENRKEHNNSSKVSSR